jgi:hypothetical protein
MALQWHCDGTAMELGRHEAAAAKSQERKKV